MYDAPWGEIQIRILAGNLHCILAMSKTTADREECPICKTRYSTNSIRTIPQHCIKACSRCRRAFKDIDLKTVQDYAVFTDALVLKLLHFLQNIGHATYLKLSQHTINTSHVRAKLTLLGDLFGQNAEGFKNCFLHYFTSFQQGADAKMHHDQFQLHIDAQKLRSQVKNHRQKQKALCKKIRHWATSHYDTVDELQ
uniref:Uncharacterized protein n=1 Tax=Guillardia theta (strain CCMP2712) TaxID=905079 RepID=A0A0C3T8E7_GUITC